MSYRPFKHLLGETNLERKCRFLAGLVILVLVTSGACWSGHQYEQLIRGEEIRTARNLAPSATTDRHLTMERTNREIRKTRASLIAASLVATALSMLASGAIIRYATVEASRPLDRQSR